MLAYAAQNRTAERTGSPKVLALIVAGHVLAIGAVMTAKMELAPGGLPFNPKVFNIPIDPPPRPPEPQIRQKTQEQRPAAQESFIDQPVTIKDMDANLTTSVDQGASIDDIAKVIGSDIGFSRIDPPTPIRIAARFNTPESALKPPYPNDKLRNEEEAVLKLKLSIDPRGRVTAVEPVGPADASFLEAARRHIIRAWRYKPATEDGIAVSSTTVITLAFRLEDV
jgi:protein TonB